METAKDKLKKMTAWDVEPTITDGELDELLVPCCIKDKEGLPPSDPGWTPTYDMNAAASGGWLIKLPAQPRWSRSIRPAREL